jgi:signal transduction histidine kinase
LVLGGFALLLLAAVVAIVVAVRQADQALTDQTQRILPARVAASQLLLSLVDQETGLRGYALTRDTSYLAPYEAGRRNEQRARTSLSRFIGPSDDAHLDLLSVDAAITAWEQEYASLRIIDIRRGSAQTTIEFGKELFDQVRSANGALDRELASEARMAKARAEHARSIVLWVIVVTAVLVALALLALQLALRRVVLDPLEQLAAQVSHVARGEHGRPIEPVGPPDVRDLAGSVESMRLELVRALADVQDQQRVLEQRAAELVRSNADLEQFAYVASHDLQEPLRKVASFCQLLEQRYGGKLDERGEQYIAFAVDGAKRMQQLITDLLAFSRVGRTSEGFVPVDLDAEVQAAWRDLDARAAETGARLEVLGVLPTVAGDASLLRVLLVNLLGNALKYRRPDRAPEVRLTGTVEEGRLRVDVADNGIGIPPEYAEKVFVIFQRLHGREEYDGTGIGLALCKRIVEFHGGSIGLRPSPLGGACVTFTLPLEESSTHV